MCILKKKKKKSASLAGKFTFNAQINILINQIKQKKQYAIRKTINHIPK